MKTINIILALSAALLLAPLTHAQKSARDRLCDPAFEPLTPLTSNLNEWMNRTEEAGGPLWQSKRCPSVFSRAAGATWNDLNERKSQEGIEPA